MVTVRRSEQPGIAPEMHAPGDHAARRQGPFRRRGAGVKGLRGRPLPQGGFTVIELMLALFFAGIVAAIAIPSFRGYVENTKLKGAARQLMTELGDVQQRAKAENAQYRITLNADPTNTYTLERLTAPTTTQTKNLAEFGNIRITASSFASNRVQFEARGILSQGGTISLRNSRSSTAVITTSQAGRTNVQYTLQ